MELLIGAVLGLAVGWCAKRHSCAGHTRREQQAAGRRVLMAAADRPAIPVQLERKAVH
jgi:hypothetical protein